MNTPEISIGVRRGPEWLYSLLYNPPEWLLPMLTLGVMALIGASIWRIRRMGGLEELDVETVASSIRWGFLGIAIWMAVRMVGGSAPLTSRRVLAISLASMAWYVAAQYTDGYRDFARELLDVETDRAQAMVDPLAPVYIILLVVLLWVLYPAVIAALP